VSEARPVVVHPDEAVASATTPGMELRHRYDPDGRWVGWSGWIRNEAADVGGWHHHADNDTFVYVIRGSVTIESGPGGADRIEARAGDFFIVPARAIHREITGDADLEAFVLRVGGEPEYIAVDGPEEAAR
jgi:mannose-6-phosphate isomerase-like protein (cupin superfamily)